MSLVLNPSTVHVLPQFHVVFDDEFTTVPFMREVTIPTNWTDLVQRSSQSGAPDNIYLKDTWFYPNPEEDPIKTLSHKPSVASDNNNKFLTLPQYKMHVQENMASKGAPFSEWPRRPYSKGG